MKIACAMLQLVGVQDSTPVFSKPSSSPSLLARNVGASRDSSSFILDLRSANEVLRRSSFLNTTTNTGATCIIVSSVRR